MKELKAERGKGRLEVEVKADRNGRPLGLARHSIRCI
jgi:hypothetical protein